MFVPGTVHFSFVIFVSILNLHVLTAFSSMSVTAEDDADVGWTPCEIAQRALCALLLFVAAIVLLNTKRPNVYVGEHISIYDVLCRQLGETRDDGDDTASVTVGGGGGGFGAKIAAPFASAADASPPAAAVSALHLLMHADERIPTGCATIDALLSGGLERGKIVECHGDIGVGKVLCSHRPPHIALLFFFS